MLELQSHCFLHDLLILDDDHGHYTLLTIGILCHGNHFLLIVLYLVMYGTVYICLLHHTGYRVYAFKSS